MIIVVVFEDFIKIIFVVYFGVCEFYCFCVCFCCLLVGLDY